MTHNRFSVFLCIFTLALQLAINSDWKSWGQNLDNSRYAEDETIISINNIGNLQVDWVFMPKGIVVNTITVEGDRLYFVDFAGFAYCLHRDGSLLWEKNITALLEYQIQAQLRTSPTIYKNSVIMGTLLGTDLFALDKLTGSLLWRTKMSTHPYAVITQSPTVYRQKVYVGVSSVEEDYGPLSGTCCTFIGSFSSVDANDGTIEWTTYMLPQNNGQQNLYAGAAVWGSAPAIDVHLGRVYIATGNDYSVPKIIQECQQCRNNSSDPANFPSCITYENHEDSGLALDIETGEIIWARAVEGWDTWNYGCGVPSIGVPPLGTSCSSVPGPDYDFGQAPMLLNTIINGENMRLAVTGQKSGILWAFNAQTNNPRGEIIWSTQICPGGISGGMIFGSATDGNRIYVSCANTNHQNFSMIDGTWTTGGVWSAVNPSNGSIIWQTPDPAGSAGATEGPVSIANGVLYGGSLDYQGHMYAMNADNGEILFSFASGASVASGASISNGHVYWSSGYIYGANPGIPKVYSFSV